MLLVFASSSLCMELNALTFTNICYLDFFARAPSMTLDYQNLKM